MSEAFNSTKSHPVQQKWANSVNRPERCFLHAEIAALVKLRTLDVEAIYVARKLKNGKTACAKPCTICVAALKDSIIENVVYTTPEGFSVMNVGA